MTSRTALPSYHTTLQRKAGVKSVLDGIPGVGPKTKQKLLRQFGSVRGIMRASQAELAAVVGEARAAQIRQGLSVDETHSTNGTVSS